MRNEEFRGKADFKAPLFETLSLLLSLTLYRKSVTDYIYYYIYVSTGME